jgi:hypothetical protein
MGVNIFQGFMYLVPYIIDHEVDKLSKKDQTFLLNSMAKCIIIYSRNNYIFISACMLASNNIDRYVRSQTITYRSS